MTQILYGRTELKLSDHRPVYGLFEAKIRKINEEKMLELEEKLIQEFNLTKKEEEQKMLVPGKFEPLEVLDGEASTTPIVGSSVISELPEDRLGSLEPSQITQPDIAA